jgi:hypothetical protein
LLFQIDRDKLSLAVIGVFKSCHSEAIIPHFHFFSKLFPFVRCNTLYFRQPQHSESELHCYIYAWAVCRAIKQNPTLGGVADRAAVAAKKFIQPKKANCGQGWEVVISLRITIEEIGNAG